MTTNDPLISIIIPHYNSSDLLKRTIKSALRQSYQAIEVIVVDDCSTDDTSSVVAKIQLQDPRVQYLRTTHQSNLPAVPRNIGVRHAKGSYIAFLDHDDLWTRNKLKKQIAFLLRNPDLSLVFSPLWQFSKINPFLGFLYLMPPVGKFASHKELLKLNYIQCSSVLLKKDALDGNSAFNENPELRAIEDYDLWLRISMNHKFGELYQILGAYRMLRTSTSRVEDMKSRQKSLSKFHPKLILSPEMPLFVRVWRRITFIPKIFSYLLVKGK